MAATPENLIALLKKWHSVPVATAGVDGTPNVAARSVRDPETIVWGEPNFMRTCENLLRHPVASLSVWLRTPSYTACQVNGRVTVHEHDQVADRVRSATGSAAAPRRRPPPTRTPGPATG